MHSTRMSVYARRAAKAVIAAGVCTAAIAPSIAQAQLNVTSTHASIRLGAFISTNSATQREFNKTFFSAGLDYYFQQSEVSERSMVSVDYIDRSSGRTHLQIVPITVGQQYRYGARAGGVRPYAGFGIGVYLINVQNPNDNNLTNGGAGSGANNDSSNGTSLGGYGDVGLDLSSNLFVDARYHLVTPYKSVNVNGLEVTAGLRF